MGIQFFTSCPAAQPLSSIHISNKLSEKSLSLSLSLLLFLSLSLPVSFYVSLCLSTTRMSVNSNHFQLECRCVSLNVSNNHSQYTNEMRWQFVCNEPNCQYQSQVYMLTCLYDETSKQSKINFWPSVNVFKSGVVECCSLLASLYLFQYNWIALNMKWVLVSFHVNSENINLRKISANNLNNKWETNNLKERKKTKSNNSISEYNLNLI